MSDREWLARLELVGIKLGLDTIGALMDALDHPERAAPAVHIAGTNGKGSVAAMMARAFQAAGHRTGRYTSPHLVHLEERMAVDGRSVPTADLDRALARVRSASERLASVAAGLQPTYFEITTAAAFEVFREARVDVSVLETGMGGRFDATTIVSPAVTVITTIGLDHESYLGTTVEAIAAEKAGIIKPGVPLVLGDLPGAAHAVVARLAADAGAPVRRVADECHIQARPVGDGRYDVVIRTRRASYGPLGLGLRGRHQVDNAAVAVLALETADEAGMAVTPQALETGLREARWPARLDLLDVGGRSLLVDGAHNPGGAAALAAYLREVYPAGLPLVFGVMADKDIEGMLAPLVPFARPLVVTRAPGRRAAQPDRVAEAARALGMPEVIVVADIAPAIHAAWGRGDTAVVAGSLYLAGAVLSLIGREP
jgi:dihydrofolate synthase/folylpolyglutamate synthase